MKIIKSFPLFVCLLICSKPVFSQDTVKIHNIGHASIMFEYGDLIFHVDPYSQEADYDTLPDADFIFVTHAHYDHYDPTALNKITGDSTVLVTTQEVKEKGTYSGNIQVMSNGDSAVFKNIPIKAVAAYNFNSTWHPKGAGNGYIFYFPNRKIYVAGDTELIPEMDSIQADIMFVNISSPYGLTQEKVVEAATKIDPNVIYAYHLRQTDTSLFRSQMNQYDTIEVRIGKSVYFEFEGGSMKYVEPSKEPVEDTVHNDIKGTELLHLNEVLVYPVIEQKELKVKLPVFPAKITIYNVDGKVVNRSTKKQGCGLGEFSIDISQLVAGVYFYRVEIKGEVKTGKFIISDSV